MQRGYVKVWRKISDSGLMQLPNTLAVFMFILLNATHKDKKVGTPTGVVELKRGQYIGGRFKLASSLKQTERQIRTSIVRLQELDIIVPETTNRYSIYTIVNYNEYQDNDQQTTNKRPTNDQQTTTKQEHKHISIKEEGGVLSIQPPHQNEKFKMHDDWEPSNSFDGMAKIAGFVFTDKVPLDELAEFKIYRITHPDNPRTQSEWEHLFIKSLIAKKVYRESRK